MRIGSGFDVHAYGPGTSIMLAGVRVPHSHGVIAWSDGDVVLHALCDALLGAAGLGDIGQHFLDSDPRWQGVESKIFVRETLKLLSACKLRIVNADITVLAETPKLAPFRDVMRQSLSDMLGTPDVNVKATTTEHLGFIGRSEGIAAQAVVLLSST